MRNEKGQFIKGLVPWNKGDGDYITKEKHWNWQGGKPKCLDCENIVSSYATKRCDSCYRKYWRGNKHPNWKGGENKLICSFCKEDFYDYLTNHKNPKNLFCSKKCKGNSIRGIALSKETRMKISNVHKQRVKEGKHYLYRGATKLSEKIRKSFEYRNWLKENMKRDNWTCQNCNKRGCVLQVDHIKPFALILIENNVETIEDALKCIELWDISNGRTLCKDCHKKTDTYGYKTQILIKQYATQ